MEANVGSGMGRLEFMHADDVAAASVFPMHSYTEYECINVGLGEVLPIRELAGVVASVVAYEGTILTDAVTPADARHQPLDVSPLNVLGWYPRIATGQGAEQSYDWFMRC
jgi:GDP-L-fucose synthase